MTLNNDIPNLARVEGGSLVIYRGGQPRYPATWDYLRDNGVGRVIKLNTEPGDEASGMDVHAFPITTWDQIAGPVERQLEDSFKMLASVGSDKRGIFVHCSHGVNRTGSLIILYRVRVCGWDLSKAIAEADTFADHGLGWGWSLPALQVYVRRHASSAAG